MNGDDPSPGYLQPTKHTLQGSQLGSSSQYCLKHTGNTRLIHANTTTHQLLVVLLLYPRVPYTITSNIKGTKQYTKDKMHYSIIQRILYILIQSLLYIKPCITL